MRKCYTKVVDYASCARNCVEDCLFISVVVIENLPNKQLLNVHLFFFAIPAHILPWPFLQLRYFK